MRNFSENLALELRKHNISQSRLSKITGIAQSAIWNYLHGRVPKGTEISKIANALGVSADWLLGLTDQRDSLDQPDDIQPKSLPETLPQAVPVSSLPTIPVVGTASAMSFDPTFGTLHDLLGDDGERVPFPFPDIRSDGVFALRVDGDSMLPTLRPGDVVACRDELPATGDLCVAMLRTDGLVCKRWYWRNGIIRLSADNEDGGKSYEWTRDEIRETAPIVFRWRVLAMFRSLV